MNKTPPTGNPKVKYVLVPGWVTDEHDGEKRFVPAHELVRLYNLKPGTYRLAGTSPSVPAAVERAVRQGLIPLYPDPTGKYSLPTTAGKVKVEGEAAEPVQKHDRRDKK